MNGAYRDAIRRRRQLRVAVFANVCRDDRRQISREEQRTLSRGWSICACVTRTIVAVGL